MDDEILCLQSGDVQSGIIYGVRDDAYGGTWELGRGKGICGRNLSCGHFNEQDFVEG